MNGTPSDHNDHNERSENAVQQLLHAAALADLRAANATYLPEAFLTRW